MSGEPNQLSNITHIADGGFRPFTLRHGHDNDCKDKEAKFNRSASKLHKEGIIHGDLHSKNIVIEIISHLSQTLD
ncbi:26845_t:CDS:2 [Dentiscutata erythropus]|uniref:26845_t:CDS:1 n=1 Tax=Dentiscutata erythropus TaxID=1348616 RepID=A0A9N8W520_9GLOM|nr:26845_t:CDS:2 [Dentiscutata erythropus]